ncbi:MAG: hypothetical protein ABI690_05110 [Chloroflexota bacterium]
MQSATTAPYIMSLHDFGFVFLIISFVMFYFTFRVGRGLVAMRVNRRPVTHEIDLAKHPVPTQIMPLAQQLEALDMQLLGVLHSRFWLLGEGYTWTYLHPDGSVYAELVQALGGMAAFDSWYPDNAHIYTSFRIGENIQLPNMHMRFAAHSLEAAYTYHREQMKRFEGTHGNPVQIQNMSDILALGKPFHELYRDRMNQRLKRFAVINFSISLVMGINMLVLTAQALSDPPLTFSVPLILFQVILWTAWAVIGLYVERQLKSPPGAIDA